MKAEELRDVLARLIEAGKGRTAAKLRAYLRAAFSMAMRAGLDPTLPEALTAFDIQVNPADRRKSPTNPVLASRRSTGQHLT